LKLKKLLNQRWLKLVNKSRLNIMLQNLSRKVVSIRSATWDRPDK